MAFLMAEQRTCARVLRAARGMAVAILLVLALVAMALVLAACTQEDPPDKTLADLATQIGALKLDDTDFATVLPAYTTEAYRANTQPEQANYQLFLAGKAADIALNKKDTTNVSVTQGTSGGARTVTFNVGGAGGLFQVADISTITVTLVKAQEGTRPWLIEAIALAR
jgi:outer membrane murein-binding lipoprotein Lpp